MYVCRILIYFKVQVLSSGFLPLEATVYFRLYGSLMPQSKLIPGRSNSSHIC